MKLIGKFTEAQCANREDKLARKKAYEESGGKIRYFFPKSRKRKGQYIMEVWGMTSEEYANSDII